MTLARSTREVRPVHAHSAQITARKTKRQADRGRPTPLHESNGSDSFTVEQQLRIAELENQVVALVNSRQQLLEQIGELERSSQHYLSLFEESPFGYVVLDSQGIIREQNQAFDSMLALKSDVR